MHKFTRRLLVMALALTSFAAAAQEATEKSDAFGQAVTPLNAESASPVARRNRITNSPQDSATDERNQRAAASAVSETGSSRRNETSIRNDPLNRGEASNRNEPFGRNEAPNSEFQKFILENTGKSLPLFGAEFFANAPSTFTPINGSPVPADYPLGVGDELTIRGWGSIDIDFRATIDRNGIISIPTIGSVSLAGVKAGDAESVVRNAVARLYKNVTISVSFGKLRAITVYVVGQARRPGTYTVSSLSTLVTALFASGGPNANGSMRHLQVKRGGKTVGELDLYAFIAKGDKSSDIKLQDGDSIFIPSAGGYVAMIGKVNNPAVYELRSSTDTIESMLELAGGLPVVADPRRAFLEHIDPSRSQPRSVEQFALDGSGVKRVLRNGDVLNVTSITPDFSNAVTLRGNVDQAVRVPFSSGMRISDLIPNREYLLTRKSIRRQNNTVNEIDPKTIPGETVDNIAAHIGGLVDEINWEYAVVERINRNDLSVSLIPFNLGRVFSAPAGTDNVVLQAGDTVTIFSQKDVAVPLDRRQVFVRIEGEVRVPGVYQMSAGDTLPVLLARAGGPTQNAFLFGTAFYREQVQIEQQINLEKAAVRLESQLRTEQARTIANSRSSSPLEVQEIEARRQAELVQAQENVSRFRRLKPTGRVSFGISPEERSFARLPAIKLENGDRLVVSSKPDFVHIFGAVSIEASALWRENSRLDDYLKKAGMTVDADVENVFVMRADGSVLARNVHGWGFGGIGGALIMPGDTIVVPEKFDKETAWSKFTKGTREWAQIFANFGLGAAAIKTLRN